MPQGNSEVPGRSVRWWPLRFRLWVILGLGAIAIVAIHLRPTYSHQQKNIYSAEVLILVYGVVLIWVLLLSRLRWRARFLAFAGLIVPVAVAAALFRIRGVSGDLVPVLELRKAERKPEMVTPNSAPAEVVQRVAVAASTNDYPQFLGPRRDGTVEGPRLARDWSARPPRLLWRQAIGPAWSGFAVQGGVAITQEQFGEDEVVTAYEVASGRLLWKHADAAHYKTTIAGEGPRTTPTIAGARVYTMGATGLLNCLDLATGRQLWTKNVVVENQGRVDDWGVSCSPLIVGDWVVVTTGAKEGRSLAAYKLESGQSAWTSGNDEASYSSPLVARLGGIPQILIFDAHSLAAHDAQSGVQLWSYPWPAGHPHIATPLVMSNEYALVSTGYGTGAELLRVQRGDSGEWKTQRVWKSNRLKSKFANLIEIGGYVYGLDDGIMVCLEVATGQLAWKEGRYGHGQIIRTRDLLLIMAENGEVVLVEPAPDKHRELTRFRALDGKTWNPPALAGEHLLVRNDLEAACYTLPVD
jgi:outer membrane protein assembly factor BamB